MRLKINWLLVGIICLASAVRLWELGRVPVSPDWDEAALGYNAYSILKTGRDEYGTWFPMELRSYDDYKPPLYVYLAIPPIALFGLDTWVVRLPSALMGIAAVVGVYYLTKELFSKESGDVSDYLAYVSAFLLAISPWHIQFSRIAFEANVGVTINIWACTFFLKGLRDRRLFSVSAFLFGLGLYAYHSERIFLPLLLLILFALYRKEILKLRAFIFIGLVVGVITVMPLFRVLFDQNSLMRLRGTSSLADQTGLLSQSVQRLQRDIINGDLFGVVFDNRRVVWAKTLVEGYISHYSLKWLFITGDNARHHAPDMGLLYFAEMPFFFMGLYWMIIRWQKPHKVIIGWFLIAPIAASPTTELPHAIRTLVFLPTFQIMTALGILRSYRFVQSLPFHIARKRMIIGTGVAVFSMNIIFYFHMYFNHTNEEYSKYWQYGYKQAVDYAQSHRDQYQKIIVSTKLEQPHMFFLYYLRYDPVKYFDEGGTRSGGFAEVKNAFDIFEFRPIHWDQESKNGSELYIGTPSEIQGTVLESIPYLDGSEAIRISKG